jgi:aldose 1-epimerase
MKYILLYRKKSLLGDALKRTPEDGFDDNFCVSGANGHDLTLACRVEHPASGRIMEVLTNQHGIQLYTGAHKLIIEL